MFPVCGSPLTIKVRPVRRFLILFYMILLRQVGEALASFMKFYYWNIFHKLSSFSTTMQNDSDKTSLAPFCWPICDLISFLVFSSQLSIISIWQLYVYNNCGSQIEKNIEIPFARSIIRNYRKCVLTSSLYVDFAKVGKMFEKLVCKTFWWLSNSIL